MRWLGGAGAIPIAAAVFSWTVAWAEPVGGEAALFDEGVKLFQRQDYEGALKQFLQAHAQNPRFQVLYNIALTHQRLGHHVAAVESYERYLRLGGEQVPPAKRKKVDDALQQLKPRVAALVLRWEGTATWLIDGESRGTSPSPDPTYLEPGPHEIVVTFEGAEPIRREIAPKAGESVELELSAPPPKPPEVKPNLPPPPTPAGPVAWLPPAGEPRSSNAATLTFAGASVASALVAGAFGAWGLEQKSELNKLLQESGDISSLKAAAYRNGANTGFTGAAIAGGVALAFAGVAASVAWERHRANPAGAK